MGVVVGDQPVTEAPPERRSGRTIGIALVITSVVVAVVALVLSGDEPGPDIATGDVLEQVELGDSGRWVRGGQIDIPTFDVVAADDRYALVASDGTILLVDRDGSVVTSHITAIELLRGVVAADGELVGWGNDLIGPAVWTSATGVSWQIDRLPWSGSVLGVAVQGERLVAIGLDSGSGIGWVSAVKDDASEVWQVEEVETPGTAIIPTGTEFLARGRISGGGNGYLRSETGAGWEELGPMVLSGMGQITEVIQTERALSIRVLGDDRVVTPPEWPVISAWLRGDRIWVHSPSAVWSTTDGGDWAEYPIDRDHGIPGGTTTILPFDDRILALVSPNPSTDRTIYTWYLEG